MSDCRPASQRTWVHVGLAPKLRKAWAYWSEFKCQECTNFGWTVAIAAIDDFIQGDLYGHSFQYEHSGVTAECKVERGPDRILILFWIRGYLIARPQWIATSMPTGEPQQREATPGAGIVEQELLRSEQYQLCKQKRQSSIACKQY